ncbi:MAG: two-component system chemotaxis sensor kinase CheA, partial [Candidatus Azotimanducaceae bacterium]
MSDDEEILQDFLVEAGEILEQLSEQLVDLERAPEDSELLNAIFRGFHTVKGGAGFLQFDSMVDLCHVAENVFDLLRKGECSVTAELMDTVLRALDSVNLMFDQIRSGDEITPADQDIIDNLGRIASGEAAAPQAIKSQSQPKPELEPELEPEAKETAPSAAVSSGNEDMISDAEFEDLLDALQDKKSTPPAPVKSSLEAPAPPGDEMDSTPAAASDEITEEEFEALLNDLEKQGKAKSTPVPTSESTPV